MGQVKQLADVDTSKYINIRVPELHIDEMVLNTEVLPPKQVKSISDLKVTLSDLVGAKLICMEPITDGFGTEDISGVTLYFTLKDGYQQIALEVYPGDYDDKLHINSYKYPKEAKENR